MLGQLATSDMTQTVLTGSYNFNLVTQALS